MTVEEAIRARVVGLSQVTALVSTRVYLDKLPQDVAYPCVRVMLVDDLESYQLRGPDGTLTARVQLDAYAQEASGVDPYASASSLAQAIDWDGAGESATGLAGWKGTVGSPPFEVLKCFRVNRTRFYDPEELRVVTISQDYLVTYRRQ